MLTLIAIVAADDPVMTDTATALRRLIMVPSPN